MASIPTKQLSKAFHYLFPSNKTRVHFGHDNEHELSLEEIQGEPLMFQFGLIYSHYGSKIFSVSPYNTEIKQYRFRIYPEAFSLSDRNNIAGLLILFKQEHIGVYKCDDGIFFTVYGKRTKMQVIDVVE